MIRGLTGRSGVLRVRSRRLWCLRYLHLRSIKLFLIVRVNDHTTSMCFWVTLLAAYYDTNGMPRSGTKIRLVTPVQDQVFAMFCSDEHKIRGMYFNPPTSHDSWRFTSCEWFRKRRSTGVWLKSVSPIYLEKWVQAWLKSYESFGKTRMSNIPSPFGVYRFPSYMTENKTRLRHGNSTYSVATLEGRQCKDGVRMEVAYLSWSTMK